MADFLDVGLMDGLWHSTDTATWCGKVVEKTSMLGKLGRTFITHRLDSARQQTSRVLGWCWQMLGAIEPGPRFMAWAW